MILPRASILWQLFSCAVWVQIERNRNRMKKGRVALRMKAGYPRLERPWEWWDRRKRGTRNPPELRSKTDSPWLRRYKGQYKRFVIPAARCPFAQGALKIVSVRRYIRVALCTRSLLLFLLQFSGAFDSVGLPECPQGGFVISWFYQEMNVSTFF